MLVYLESSSLSGAVGLDPAKLDGEGLVLAAHNNEAPGLALESTFNMYLFPFNKSTVRAILINFFSK